MSNFLTKFNLQNPFWQGVSAVATIIAIIVSIFISYDIYEKSVKFSELTVKREDSYNLIDFGESSNRRLKITVDGESISNARVYYYTLKNTGKSPILPNDYTEPIKVYVNKPFRILFVEKERSHPESIMLTWNKIDDNSYKLKPLLLNPGDSFTTLVFVSAQSEKSLKKNVKAEIGKKPLSSNKTNIADDKSLPQQSSPDPNWAARIVNVSDLKITNYTPEYEAETKSLGIFYTSFSHWGWGVYRFGVLTLILFTVGLFFGVQYGILHKNSLISHLLISILMMLSLVTGDNFASRIRGVQDQPIISNLSVILYFVLIIFFISPIMRKKKNSTTI